MLDEKLFHNNEGLLDDEAGNTETEEALTLEEALDTSAGLPKNEVGKEAAKQPEAQQDGENRQAEELALLREELALLRAELHSREQLDRANERMRNELAEFCEYFPQTELSEIPDDIWEKVKRGGSLSSAYALHLRKSELERQRVGDFNKKNRQMSAGSLDSGDGEQYFSPSEVRKMTPAQVKKNYDVIMESMRHWN